MTDLAAVLDELAAGAPVESANWSDVCARSRRRALPLSSRRRGPAIAVALLALALTGAAIGIGADLLTQQERFHDARRDDPRRRGPLVEITSGHKWALIAWNSDAGICLDFAIPGNSPFSCGFPVRGAKPASDASGAGPPTHAVAGTVSSGGLVGGDGKAAIFGVAASEVAKVDVELRDGRIVEAPLFEAPPQLDADVQFFIVRLTLPPRRLNDEAPVSAFIAYDGAGNVIERFAG